MSYEQEITNADDPELYSTNLLNNIDPYRWGNSSLNLFEIFISRDDPLLDPVLQDQEMKSRKSGTSLQFVYLFLTWVI